MLRKTRTTNKKIPSMNVNFCFQSKIDQKIITAIDGTNHVMFEVPTDGRVGGWMDGRMNRLMDGWMGRWMNE